jgi:hypothetical protein
MSTNEPSAINRWLATIPVSSIGWVFLVSGLLFWVGGAYYTVTSLAHDRSLEEQGRTADGTVLEKTVRTTIERKAGRRSHEGSTRETSYLVAFRFSTLGETISGKVEVDKDVWDRLQENGPIKVTYLPDEPEIHRVEGQDADFQIWKLFIAVGGGGLMLFVGKLLLAGKLELSSKSESED